MASSSAVVFDWVRLRPTGLARFRGLFGLTHTPILAWVSVEPFDVQEPLVKMTMLEGDWFLGSRLAGSMVCFDGSVKIRKVSWISPVVCRFWLKSFMPSGWPMAWFKASLTSAGEGDLSSRWSVSWGLNLGEISCRRRKASFRQEFGWGQPEPQ